MKPDGSEASEGNAALDNIFEKINEAYKGSNNGTELETVEFKDNKSLDNYVTSTDYVEQALCFALGWN